MNVEFFQKLNEFLFAVVTMKSTRNEDSVSVYSGQKIPTWIALVVKILDTDEFFLEGILKLCMSGMKISFQYVCFLFLNRRHYSGGTFSLRSTSIKKIQQ